MRDTEKINVIDSAGTFKRSLFLLRFAIHTPRMGGGFAVFCAARLGAWAGAGADDQVWRLPLTLF